MPYEQKKGGWEEVGVAWERETLDNHGNVTNRWIKIAIDKHIYRGEQLGLYKQTKETWEKRYKRPWKDGDPSLVLCRNAKWANKFDSRGGSEGGEKKT